MPHYHWFESFSIFILNAVLRVRSPNISDGLWWTLWLALCPRTLNSVIGATAGLGVQVISQGSSTQFSSLCIRNKCLITISPCIHRLFLKEKKQFSGVWNSAAEENVQRWRGSHTLELQPISKWVQYSPLTVHMQAWKTMSRMCVCGGGGMQAMFCVDGICLVLKAVRWKNECSCIGRRRNAYSILCP